jgi:hypothetical protein
MPVVERFSHRAAIAGHITDSVTNQAIFGAVVEIRGQTRITRTDGDGFYYFLDLPSGSYLLDVTVPWAGSRYAAASAPNVAVQDDPEGRPIFDAKASVALPPTRLTGRVLESVSEKPIQAAIIRVRGGEAKEVTDKDGKYVLSGLQSGTPAVQVSATGYITAAQRVTLTAGLETIADFSLSKM